MRSRARGAPRRGGGRLRGGLEPALGQVGGVGEAGGVADDDPDAGAAVAPGGQLLDLAVVEPGGRRPPVLDEDLGEVAASAQCGPENALDDRGVEHRGPFTAGGGFSQAYCDCIS